MLCTECCAAGVSDACVETVGGRVEKLEVGAISKAQDHVLSVGYKGKRLGKDLREMCPI